MDSLHCNFINDTHIGANSVSLSYRTVCKGIAAGDCLYNEEPNWAEGIYFIDYSRIQMPMNAHTIYEGNCDLKT